MKPCQLRNTPVADYRKRMEEITLRLKATGAKLVWATTTPIHEDPTKNYTPSNIDERNAAAAEIMEKHGVAMDDMNVLIAPYVSTDRIPNDVHYKASGNERLGAEVARVIAEVLHKP